MKLHPTILAGLVSCLGLLVIYTYLVVSTITAKNTVASSEPVVSAKMFESAVFRQIEQKSVNGPLPITINPADIGRPNPFQ